MKKYKVTFFKKVKKSSGGIESVVALEEKTTKVRASTVAEARAKVRKKFKYDVTNITFIVE